MTGWLPVNVRKLLFFCAAGVLLLVLVVNPRKEQPAQTVSELDEPNSQPIGPEPSWPATGGGNQVNRTKLHRVLKAGAGLRIPKSEDPDLRRPIQLMSDQDLLDHSKFVGNRPSEDLADPVWQEFMASFVDWQPVFEEDWECRKKHEKSPGSVFGCAFDKVLVVRRIADGLGQITRAAGISGEDPKFNRACVEYAECHAQLYLGMVIPMPDNSPSPSIWRERAMIPSRGTLPDNVEGTDELMEIYAKAAADFEGAAVSDPELGFKALYFRDLVGTLKLYKEKVIAGDMP